MQRMTVLAPARQWSLRASGRVSRLTTAHRALALQQPRRALLVAQRPVQAQLAPLKHVLQRALLQVVWQQKRPCGARGQPQRRSQQQQRLPLARLPLRPLRQRWPRQRSPSPCKT